MLAGTRKPIVVSSPFGGASLRVMVEMAATWLQAATLACLTMSSPPCDYTEWDRGARAGFANGTSDEMTLVLSSGGEYRKITLEVTTALVSVGNVR